MANALLLEPILALGGQVTRGLLNAIDALGVLATAAAECTHLVSAGTLVGAALGAGLLLGVASLPLSQRLRTNKSNLALLREDLAGIPGLVREWLFYAVASLAYSRVAASDARVSYGEAPPPLHARNKCRRVKVCIGRVSLFCGAALWSDSRRPVSAVRIAFSGSCVSMWAALQSQCIWRICAQQLGAAVYLHAL